MKYFKRNESERLYLSPINTDDFEIYTKWINDPIVARNIGAFWSPYTFEKEKEFLETMAEGDNDFAIVLKDGDRLIGNTSFQNINRMQRLCEVGLFIGEESDRGKGYGSEALKLMLDFGFNVLNFNNILLKVFAFNEPAIKCYERVGFTHLGRRRDAFYFDGQYHDDVYMDMTQADYRKIYK